MKNLTRFAIHHVLGIRDETVIPKDCGHALMPKAHASIRSLRDASNDIARDRIVQATGPGEMTMRSGFIFSMSLSEILSCACTSHSAPRRDELPEIPGRGIFVVDEKDFHRPKVAHPRLTTPAPSSLAVASGSWPRVQELA